MKHFSVTPQKFNIDVNVVDEDLKASFMYSIFVIYILWASSSLTSVVFLY